MCVQFYMKFKNLFTYSWTRLNLKSIDSTLGTRLKNKTKQTRETCFTWTSPLMKYSTKQIGFILSPVMIMWLYKFNYFSNELLFVTIIYHLQDIENDQTHSTLWNMIWRIYSLLFWGIKKKKKKLTPCFMFIRNPS